MNLPYVVDTVRALHPGAELDLDGSSTSSVFARYVLVPSADRPALVLPADAPAAAARACTSYSEAQGRIRRWRGSVLGRTFAWGLGDRLFRDRVAVLSSDAPGLDAFLEGVVGEPLALAFPVGRVRANRKPVVLAIDEVGDVRAFVKLGVNDLTDRLVLHETASLARLSDVDFDLVQIPEVLHQGSWGGHPLLVMAALPVGRGRVRDPSRSMEQAMIEVSGATGTSTVALGDLPWWKGIEQRVHAAGPEHRAERLRDVWRALSRQSGRTVLAGSWHGDWNPGNVAVVRGAVLLWDWERFAEGVPVGWDALHLELGRIVPRNGRISATSLRALLDLAPRLLEPFGLDRLTAELSSTTYLLELGTRYVEDDQAGLGVALGAVEDWLLPVLEDRVAALDLSSRVLPGQHGDRPRSQSTGK